ncbi:MAG: carbohydrate ABC transporter permease [Nocardioidaceae bacterium]
MTATESDGAAVGAAPAVPDREAPAVESRSGRRPVRPARTQIIVVVLLTVAALYFLLPVYWLAVSATKSTEDLFGSFGLLLSEPQLLSNLMDLATYDSGIYLRWLFNSAFYAGVGATGATLLAAMAGYALAKYQFRGREAIFGIVIAGVLLPGTALALPLYLLMSQVDLVNTYWAVLLPSMVTPFGVYLCRIYASAAVSDDLIEAARLDGAGELRIFFTIGLRVMAPALATVFLFQFVDIWNNYFLPLVMLSDSDLYPMTLGLTSWLTFADREPTLYQLTVGGAFVSVIPLMVAMVVLQRFVRMGMTEGSIKG